MSEQQLNRSQVARPLEDLGRLRASDGKLRRDAASARLARSVGCDRLGGYSGRLRLDSARRQVVDRSSLRWRRARSLAEDGVDR